MEFRGSHLISAMFSRRPPKIWQRRRAAIFCCAATRGDVGEPASIARHRDVRRDSLVRQLLRINLSSVTDFRNSPGPSGRGGRRSTVARTHARAQRSTCRMCTGPRRPGTIEGTMMRSGTARPRPAIAGRYNTTVWCPGPESNRHGVAPGGF